MRFKIKALTAKFLKINNEFNERCIASGSIGDYKWLLQRLHYTRSFDEITDEVKTFELNTNITLSSKRTVTTLTFTTRLLHLEYCMIFYEFVRIIYTKENSYQIKTALFWLNNNLPQPLNIQWSFEETLIHIFKQLKEQNVTSENFLQQNITIQLHFNQSAYEIMTIILAATVIVPLIATVRTF